MLCEQFHLAHKAGDEKRLMQFHQELEDVIEVRYTFLNWSGIRGFSLLLTMHVIAPIQAQSSVKNIWGRVSLKVGGPLNKSKKLIFLLLDVTLVVLKFLIKNSWK